MNGNSEKIEQQLSAVAGLLQQTVQALPDLVLLVREQSETAKQQALSISTLSKTVLTLAERLPKT